MVISVEVDGIIIHRRTIEEYEKDYIVTKYSRFGYGQSKESWAVYLTFKSKLNKDSSNPKLLIKNRVFNVKEAYELKQAGWSLSGLCGKYNRRYDFISKKIKSYEKYKLINDVE